MKQYDKIYTEGTGHLWLANEYRGHVSLKETLEVQYNVIVLDRRELIGLLKKYTKVYLPMEITPNTFLNDIGMKKAKI